MGVLGRRIARRPHVAPSFHPHPPPSQSRSIEYVVPRVRVFASPPCLRWRWSAGAGGVRGARAGSPQAAAGRPSSRSEQTAALAARHTRPGRASARSHPRRRSLPRQGRRPVEGNRPAGNRALVPVAPPPAPCIPLPTAVDGGVQHTHTRERHPRAGKGEGIPGGEVTTSHRPPDVQERRRCSAHASRTPTHPGGRQATTRRRPPRQRGEPGGQCAPREARRGVPLDGGRADVARGRARTPLAWGGSGGVSTLTTNTTPTPLSPPRFLTATWRTAGGPARRHPPSPPALPPPPRPSPNPCCRPARRSPRPPPPGRTPNRAAPPP